MIRGDNLMKPGLPGSRKSNETEVIIMTDYSKMTHDDEVRILGDLIEKAGRNILSLEPECYSPLREYFNDEILDRWENQQKENDTIIYIYNQNCIMAGSVVNSEADDFDSGCSDFWGMDLEAAFFFAGIEVKNSRDHFRQKSGENALKEFERLGLYDPPETD